MNQKEKWTKISDNYTIHNHTILCSVSIIDYYMGDPDFILQIDKSLFRKIT